MPSGDETGNTDETNIQNAINSALLTGKSILGFRPGRYYLKSSIQIPSHINAMIGNGSQIVASTNWAIVSDPGILVSILQGSGNLLIENLEFSDHNKTNSSLTVIKHAAPRSLILRKLKLFHQVNMISYSGLPGAGNVFIENVASLNGTWNFNHQNIWAKQFNVEGCNTTKIVNNSSELWVLGLKTEKNSTVLSTQFGGRSEVFAGFILFEEDEPTQHCFDLSGIAFSDFCKDEIIHNGGQVCAPAFVNDNSQVFLNYSVQPPSTGISYFEQVRTLNGPLCSVITNNQINWPGKTWIAMPAIYSDAIELPPIQSLLLDNSP
jgi:hypothetical protein